MKPKIPRIVIPRLSIYYRALFLSPEDSAISSAQLSDLTGYTPDQIRKDLAYFGQFGTPGRGYRVSDLKKEILRILGMDRLWNVALVGVGNLGSALLSYKGFRELGFNIIAAFDHDLRKIGKKFEDVTIQDISELKNTVKDKKIQMAIVTVTAKDAQKTIDSLIKSGIKAIMNFAPIRPKLPRRVELVNIDLSIELERLAHFLRKKKS